MTLDDVLEFVDKLIDEIQTTAYKNRDILNICKDDVESRYVINNIDKYVLNTTDKTFVIVHDKERSIKRINYEFRYSNIGDRYGELEARINNNNPILVLSIFSTNGYLVNDRNEYISRSKSEADIFYNKISRLINYLDNLKGN